MVRTSPHSELLTSPPDTLFSDEMIQIFLDYIGNNQLNQVTVLRYILAYPEYEAMLIRRIQYNIDNAGERAPRNRRDALEYLLAMITRGNYANRGGFTKIHKKYKNTKNTKKYKKNKKNNFTKKNKKRNFTKKNKNTKKYNFYKKHKYTKKRKY
jgi:hypothetical protein